MHDELVKRLRQQVECDKKTYPQGPPYETLLIDLAADAIEELSSQLDDFKRLCLPLEENKLYKFADGSFTEVSLMIVPRLPLPEPPKGE